MLLLIWLLGKPVLLMRDKIERPEAVDAGTVRLIWMGEERIVRQVEHLLDDENAHARMAKAQPYGDDHAAERILERILGYLSG